jgi:hypothetical protein
MWIGFALFFSSMALIILFVLCLALRTEESTNRIAPSTPWYLAALLLVNLAFAIAGVGQASSLAKGAEIDRALLWHTRRQARDIESRLAAAEARLREVEKKAAPPGARIPGDGSDLTAGRGP